MTDTPLVSVIIPTFNSEKYIGRCLSALALNAYPALEVIIVDAGSTDQTRAIVGSFQFILSIRYLTLSPSTQSEARNVGLKNASGKYIAFCDSDDFFLPGKIKKQVDAVEKNQADVVYFDALHFYSDRQSKFFINRTQQTNDMLASSIHCLMMNLNAMLVRKSFLDKNQLTFPQGEMGRYAEDWNFVFHLALHHAKFFKLDEHLAVVEVRKDSHTQWSLQWKMKSVVIQFLTDNRSQMSPYHQSLVDESVKNLQRKMIVGLVLAGQFAEAKALFKSLTLSSRRSGVYPGMLKSGAGSSIGFFFLRLFPKKLLDKIIITLWERNRKKHRQTYVKLNAGTQKYLNEILG
ncbi:MAG: glycosyltransferase family 2 protein [Gammaproteobacteria bacterium]|nr:glycosyltransferase family 2 protein [Gammaproteobacteria bacterium]